jgi:hypothetical protein
VKVGDLVSWAEVYAGSGSIGLIVSVGYGEEYTDTEQSCALHPDIWVLVNGYKERWNERYVEVINESRRLGGF